MKEANERSIYEGQVPIMDKFVKFWAGIWENESETPNKKCMKKIKRNMKDKIRQVKQLQITEKELGKTIKKRKNWLALGIDEIPNFCWKILRSTWGKLAAIMQEWTEDSQKVPKCLPLGRTVLIRKTEDLSSQKDYRPITCLNTLYKIFSGILPQNVKKHVVQNNL